LLHLRQKIDELMHATVGLLRAGFEQIVKFFVVPEKFANREHGSV
jgi:hypothetical protein